MIYTLTLNPAVDRELTVPDLTFDTVLRAVESRVDVGGKGFNVSRLLQEMGTASTAVALLGGRTGEMLRDGLAALGIPTDFVWVPDETRTNVSIVTPAHGHSIKVNESGPVILPEKQSEILRNIEARTQAGDWWVMSGSLPPGIPDDFYARAIGIVNTARAYAILDTSGEALRLGCTARPTLVKPNLTEAQLLTGQLLETGKEGTQSELIACAAAIKAIGPENVIISSGGSGALLYTGQGAWMARSPTIEERNPIGAGDALVGGVVWAMNQSFDLPEALGWGVACGAAAASQDGTGVGSRQRIEALHLQVTIERIR